MDLDRSARLPLRAQLEQSLRERIRSGALRPGTVLPSTRILAADLTVSRRLVVEAYQQLIAEGYLVADERSRTTVAAIDLADAGRTRVGEGVAAQPSEKVRYDLRPGTPALAQFPRADWLKSVTAVLRRMPDDALANPDPRGCAPLREVVADYLHRVRAVRADPDRIVVCAGFTQALSLLTRVLDGPVVGLEDPGLAGRDRVVAMAGGSWVPVPVDGQGLRVDLLAASEAEAVVVTPAHQFPLGNRLSARRRAELVEWSRRGRLVVEDDYDSEFRYDRQPVAAIQGTAPEQVVYVGTVSKTLAPGLRLGWMVLPAHLVDMVAEARRHHDMGSPVINQLALADLMASGAYERHLRLVRRQYREQRDRLVAALAARLPEATVTGGGGGLHLVVRLPGHGDLAETVAGLAGELAVTTLDRYLLTRPARPGDGLVLGYANIKPDAVDAAVALLAAALRAARPQRC